MQTDHQRGILEDRYNDRLLNAHLAQYDEHEWSDAEIQSAIGRVRDDLIDDEKQWDDDYLLAFGQAAIEILADRDDDKPARIKDARHALATGYATQLVNADQDKYCEIEE